jgi:hypothetical protein
MCAYYGREAQHRTRGAAEQALLFQLRAGHLTARRVRNAGRGSPMWQWTTSIWKSDTRLVAFGALVVTLCLPAAT